MNSITKKELTSSLGLILMFALGWIANDLVSQIGSDDKVERDQMRQRMNRLEIQRQEIDRREDRNRQQRWDMQQYNDERGRWERKKDKTERV